VCEIGLETESREREMERERENLMPRINAGSMRTEEL